MAELVWDETGKRLYETGVDHGVLYIPDTQGHYNDGVAWNGLTTVTESPSGAEANAQYADNIKYLNLFSAEQFGATVEAFTYPDEWMQFDGLATPSPGVAVGQQSRKTFGLSYRSRVGNDIEGEDYGYKLHLLYGCQASPSERAYQTINDSPAAIAFSWAVTTTPVNAGPDLKPTALITVSSAEVDSSSLSALEQLLYGTAAVDPSLPLPVDVIALFEGTIIVVTTVAPTYVQATNTITIPTVVGVTYSIDGAAVTGDIVITKDTVVTARADSGYILSPGSDNDWSFTF